MYHICGKIKKYLFKTKIYILKNISDRKLIVNLIYKNVKNYFDHVNYYLQKRKIEFYRFKSLSCKIITRKTKNYIIENISDSKLILKVEV